VVASLIVECVVFCCQCVQRCNGMENSDLNFLCWISQALQRP
jgi:hypothetical protein